MYKKVQNNVKIQKYLSNPFSIFSKNQFLSNLDPLLCHLGVFAAKTALDRHWHGHPFDAPKVSTNAYAFAEANFSLSSTRNWETRIRFGSVQSSSSNKLLKHFPYLVVLWSDVHSFRYPNPHDIWMNNRTYLFII